MSEMHPLVQRLPPVVRRLLLSSILLGIAALIMKWTTLDFLADMDRRADQVTLSKGVVLWPAFALLGLVALVMPENFLRGKAALFRDPATGKTKPLGILIGVVFVAPGAALYIWLNMKMNAAGYSSR